MRPPDLGLPEKFSEFRPGQLEVALDIAESGKRFSSLPAPTGTGKSLIYMTVGRILGARTLVLVGTKGLQDQLLKDFGSMGAVDIRGAGNYKCLEVEAHYTSCDKGPCHDGYRCALRNDGCLYYDAQRRARDAQVVVSNYAYWTSLARYSDPTAIGVFDLLVLDEAHTAPEWLAAMMTLTVQKAVVRRHLGQKAPPATTPIDEWSQWAVEVLPAAKDEHARLIQKYGRVNNRDADDLNRLIQTLGDLARIEIYEDTTWVIDGNMKRVKLSPVWAREFAEPYMFRDIPRVVLSSATMSNSMNWYLGIAPRWADEHVAESRFAKRRRPFTYVPTVKVSHKTEGNPREMKKWIARIDEIIAGRLDTKGIIHTRSYKRMQYIKDHSKYGEHMMIHDSWTTKRTVESFKNMSAPAILVSPSVEEGFDFPHDECRWQIIAKVPFIDTRDGIDHEREKSHKQYPFDVAGLTIVQMAGRGMRAADDHCETFIVDNLWPFLRSKTDFPEWFDVSCRKVRSVPQPLTPEQLSGGVIRKVRRKVAN